MWTFGFSTRPSFRVNDCFEEKRNITLRFFCLAQYSRSLSMYKTQTS